jgi:hypothetical protein
MGSQQLPNGAVEETEKNPNTGGVDRHYSVPGGVFHNPAGAYAREMAKYEMGWSPFGPPGRPRDGRAVPYPCRMYLVKRADTGGGVVIVHSADAVDEAQERNFRSRGYYNGLAEAAEALTASEQEAAVLAAERGANERGMSDKAKAEAAAFEEGVSGHVPVIPEAARKTGKRE